MAFFPEHFVTEVFQHAAKLKEFSCESSVHSAPKLSMLIYPAYTSVTHSGLIFSVMSDSPHSAQRDAC